MIQERRDLLLQNPLLTIELARPGSCVVPTRIDIQVWLQPAHTSKHTQLDGPNTYLYRSIAIPLQQAENEKNRISSRGKCILLLLMMDCQTDRNKFIPLFIQTDRFIGCIRIQCAFSFSNILKAELAQPKESRSELGVMTRQMFRIGNRRDKPLGLGEQGSPRRYVNQCYRDPSLKQQGSDRVRNWDRIIPHIHMKTNIIHFHFPIMLATSY